jgi:hypothetical protein
MSRGETGHVSMERFTDVGSGRRLDRKAFENPDSASDQRDLVEPYLSAPTE